MKTKHILALLLAVAMTFALASCGTAGTSSAESAASDASASAEGASAPQTSSDKKELIVFAAASMTETLTELKDKYESSHPDITITYNFDSSGTLKTQIQEGSACDLFISAAQLQMDQMDAADTTGSNTEKLDLVRSDSRVNLLENKVTLVVPKDNPKGIKSFEQLAEQLKAGKVLIAMGNSDVPVGQYTQKILTYYQLNEQELASKGSITYGTNVKEVTTQVSEGSVDCGVVYATDAYSAGLEVVDTATTEMCGQAIYPAAVLTNSKNPEDAQAFLDYLTGDEAMEVFERVGFNRVA